MTLEELNKLDDGEIVRGYLKSREGYVLSGEESPSFIHGWKNGQVDFHGEPISAEQAELAREFVRFRPN
ncbi:hypothetical protein MKK42_23685 [Escherichia coli]|uniref:hypothetical protein n=1 Tax=Escherichia coli TaxID=562 RepID=UPI001F582708|nr:hypothetical protein [Escherichia coli]MCI2235046.1 hypothetical protein [Escherichia coli]